MIYQTLRKSGGTYSTVPAMIAGFASLCPLTDDVTIKVQRGAVFGVETTAYTVGVGCEWNNHNLFFVGDPATDSKTPAVMLGSYYFTASTTGAIFVNFSKLTLGFNDANNNGIVTGAEHPIPGFECAIYAAGDSANGQGGTLCVDNCLAYHFVNESYTENFNGTAFFCDNGINYNPTSGCFGGYVSQCSYFMANSSDVPSFFLYLSSTGPGGGNCASNSIIGVYSEVAIACLDGDDYSSAGGATTILGYDYSGGNNLSFSNAQSAVIGNPSLTSKIINSVSDSITTMRGRNAMQKPSSSRVINKGYAELSIPSTMYSPDILFITRFNFDLGAYQYGSVAPIPKWTGKMCGKASTALSNFNGIPLTAITTVNGVA